MPLYPPATQVGVSGGSATSNTAQTGGVTATGDLIALHVDANGNLFIDLTDGAGSPISSTAGSLNVNLTGGTLSLSHAADDILIYGNDGSLDQKIATDTAGRILVVQPTGTNLHAVVDSGSIIVTQATGTNLHTVVDSGTITANIGTTNGLALNATVAALQVTQGSATFGQKGPLVQGAVSATSASYSDGETQPLSLTPEGGLRVDGSAVTQPIMGTVTADIGATNGLALNISLLNGSQKTQIVDGSGNVITSTLDSGKQALDVNIAGGVTIDVSLDHTTDNILVYGNDGTTDRKIKTNAAGEVQVDVLNFPATQPISAVSLPLPTGAATETTLAAIKTDADKFTFASTRLIVDNSQVTQPISAASLPLPTGASTETTLSALNTKVTTTANGIKVDGSAVTQPISAASLPLPSGAATAANQATEIASLSSVDTKLTTTNSTLSNIDAGIPATLGQTTMANSMPVTLASDQTALPVSQSGVWTTRMQDSAGNPVNATGGALQVTITGGAGSTESHTLDLAGDTYTPGTTKGVATAARVVSSAPSLTAGQFSDITLTTLGRLIVDGSQVTQPISVVSLPLPTGASTSANQATEIASLSSIDGKLTTTNSSLSSIDAGIPAALGQTTMAASMPVTLASNQSALPVSQSGSWTVNLATESIEIGTVDQGTPASVANAWPLKITDGTNTAIVSGSGALSVDTELPAAVALTSDGITPTVPGVATYPYYFNGASWDRALSIYNGFSGIGPGMQPTPVVGQLDDLGTIPALENQWMAIRITPQRAEHVNLRNQAGTEIGTAGAPVRVDPVGTTTQPVSGTGNFTVVQPTGTNLHAVIDSGTITVTQATGTNLHVVVDNFSADSDALAQGSSTAGQLGALIQGAVTTAAPTYTTGQTNPLSLTTTGLLRVDGSGITQPVSGTITVVQPTGTNLHMVVDSGTITVGNATLAVTQSGTWNINNISGTISLPTGASTETTLAKLTLAQGSTTAGQSGTLIQAAATTSPPSYTDGQTSPLTQTLAGRLRTDIGAIGGTAITLGQKTMANSFPVVLASDNGIIVAQGSATAGQSGPIIQGSVTTAAPAYTTGQTSPLSLTTTGSLRTDNTSWLGSVAPTVGQKTMANSIPIVIASDQAPVTTVNTHSSTGTSANVASSASVVTLQAANTARKGLTIFNDSTQNLFIKLGAGAALTSFTSRLISQAYYEVPFDYDGIVTGIWAAANGNARMTELT